jgi:hypothetical protein
MNENHQWKVNRKIVLKTSSTRAVNNSKIEQSTPTVGRHSLVLRELLPVVHGCVHGESHLVRGGPGLSRRSNRHLSEARHEGVRLAVAVQVEFESKF